MYLFLLLGRRDSAEQFAAGAGLHGDGRRDLGDLVRRVLVGLQLGRFAFGAAFLEFVELADVGVRGERGESLGVLDIERRSHELLVQSFHLFDDALLVIKTQAIIEVSKNGE